MRSVAWDRAAAIEQVREDVWRYVTAASRREAGVLATVAALLDLPQRDVRALALVHFLLGGEVERLLAGMPELARRLATTTTHESESAEGELRGAVRWSQTYGRRAATGSRRLYVTTQPRRAFDTPENRVLAFALETIVACGGAVDWLGRGSGEQANRVSRLAAEATRWLQSRALADLPRTRPDPKTVAKVRHGRRRRRYEPALAVLDLHERLVRRCEAEAICAAVARHGLVTSSDATLFELRCLFAAIATLRAAGWAASACELLRPGVVFRGRRGAETIELHQRRLPTAFAARSRYLETLRAHGVGRIRSLMPDLLLRVRGGDATRWVMIEAKCTAEVDDGVRRALRDLMTYRSDFAAALRGQEGIVAIGCAWGAELAPACAERIVLCTPDTFAGALALAGVA